MRPSSNGPTRRDLLKLSAAGILFGSVSGWFNRVAAAAQQMSALGTSRHKSCILLWMNGGPSQSHTFDLKPDSQFKAISTTVPGIEISEYLPKLAKQMQHMALLRSMSTKEAVHGRARYLLHNGFRQAGGQTYPALGRVAANELGDKSAELPNFVAIDGGVDGNNAGGAFRSVPSFLGPKNAPLIVNDPSRGVENLKAALALNDFDARYQLMEQSEKEFAQRTGAASAVAHDAAYQQAVRLLHSEKSRVFEIERESQAVRDGYGDSQFGKSCLLARRLVEVGVPFVEVTLGGWDDHGGAANGVKRRSPYMDQAMAALIEDLNSRGMLNDTLVIWTGEFGRSPGNGSQHYPCAWTSMLAGGGLKTGQVIGKTDPSGKEVADRPISAPDFQATVYKALGIDPTKEFTTRGGRPIALVDKGAKPVQELFA